MGAEAGAAGVPVVVVAARAAGAAASCSPAKLALVSFTMVNTIMNRATAPTIKPVSAAPRSEERWAVVEDI